MVVKAKNKKKPIYRGFRVPLDTLTGLTGVFINTYREIYIKYSRKNIKNVSLAHTRQKRCQGCQPCQCKIMSKYTSLVKLSTPCQPPVKAKTYTNSYTHIINVLSRLSSLSKSAYIHSFGIKKTFSGMDKSSLSRVVNHIIFLEGIMNNINVLFFFLGILCVLLVEEFMEIVIDPFLTQRKIKRDSDND